MTLDARALLMAVRAEALSASHPRARVQASLLGMTPPDRPIRAIALGKAASAMLEGARDAWNIAEDDARVFAGAHPVPDHTSIDAADSAITFARDGGDALRLFLVSGGASSMLCAPHEDGSLELKQRVTAVLLGAGLDVASMNVVRAHLSRIKGGGLARAAGNAPRITVVVSDVLLGDASAVGSGPTLPDLTTGDDARRIADSVGLTNLPFHETPKNLGPAPCIVAASPQVLAEETARALEARGIRARILAPSVVAPEELFRDYVHLASTLQVGHAIVRVAEPTMLVHAAAGTRGGRCTHLAAMMAGNLPPGVHFLAAASDGIDGGSGTAGAIVSREIDGAADAIARFDTGPFHCRAGTAIAEGATGNNLADLHVLVRLT
ncbi:glycerate kinase [soil metagenome]